MNKKSKFIEKSKEVHGGKYNYSKVEYVNSHTKVCIICPIHGEFWQEPYNHTNGHGCYFCGNRKKTTNDFIIESKKIHGDKYDYSKSEYKSANSKIIVTCRKHGDFYIRASSHLQGCGCKKCAIEKTSNLQRKKYEDFIAEAKKIHGNKYDYSKVEYVNNRTKVCIICPEHGEFWQTPNAHLKLYEGCPLCKNSRMCDYLINAFKENNIDFELEKKFEWLKYDNNMLLDFYLPKYNIAIECQGGQHFVSVKKYKGDGGLEVRQKRDFEKNKQCLEHNVRILYIIPRRYNSYIGTSIYNADNSLIFEDKNFFNNLKDIIEKKSYNL